MFLVSHLKKNETLNFFENFTGVSLSLLVGPPLLIPVFFHIQIIRTMITRRDWVVRRCVNIFSLTCQASSTEEKQTLE